MNTYEELQFCPLDIKLNENPSLSLERYFNEANGHINGQKEPVNDLEPKLDSPTTLTDGNLDLNEIMSLAW